MRTATDGDEDSLDLGRAALLDHGDVARRVADNFIDRRREDGGRGTWPGWRLAAPAEDDEIGFQLRCRLHHALGGATSDADDGVNRDALRREVQNALEQPASLSGPGGTLAQRRAFRNLDDAQDGQAAGAAVHQRSPEADQLLGGERVGDRDENPGRQRRAGHRAALPAASPAVSPATAVASPA